jgi:subtilase family serine protease
LGVALIGIFAFVPAAAPAASTGLQFVPLAQMGPRVSASAVADPSGCIAIGLIHCYTPDDIASAYGVDAVHDAGWTGAGETIVIVDSYGSPTALSDLQTFDAAFGLPDPNLTIHYPCGTPSFSNAMHGVQAGWAEETSLDLQWAHAIAPDADLVLVAANPAETQGVQGFDCIFKGEQWAIANYPGAVLSQSFAVTEQSFHQAGSVQVARFDAIYEQAKDAGITIFGSSGDSGSANGDKQGRLFPFPTVNWPSSDPLVTSAGGTWLQFGWRWDPTVSADEYYQCVAGASDPDATCLPDYLAWDPSTRTEAVWKEDWLPAAGGGGRSTLFSTPAFQSGISQAVLQGSRGIPDLSWNAAVDGGVLVHLGFLGADNNGFYIFGGTSASSPQLAAVVALANQARHAAGKDSIGYLNPLLYTLPSSDFMDVVPQTFGTGDGLTTLDSNEQFGTGVAGMPTTAGWDLSTGFGSPNVPAFVGDLVAAP